MPTPEPAPVQSDVWPPPPQGQGRAFPSPKIRPRVDVFSVLKYGLAFGIGFGLCAFSSLLGLGLAYSALPPDMVPWTTEVALPLIGMVVSWLFCQWFRFYYRSFGLWMVRGVYVAGVLSLLLLCLRITFPDLFSRLFVPHAQAL